MVVFLETWGEHCANTPKLMGVVYTGKHTCMKILLFDPFC